jgi:4-amino-4-deoxy-L-arabinose transferase-like glycosyltransferase
MDKSKISQTLPFYLLACGVFLIIASKDLFSNGMFVDGLIYSSVSKNLADGIGTFWNPHFTSTLMAEFHEHPPFAFGIQSIFFSILGESRLVDRLFSLLTVVITGCILLKIWTTSGYKNGWFPLLLWFITPALSWACCNNILENTMTIFTSLSVLFYLVYQNRKKYFFIFLSGFMLTLGFLTKGFVAFFPWTFPFILWFLLKQNSFGRMISDSTGIILSTISPLLLLILLFPDARLSLQKYLDVQVLNSLKNVVTVDSRFYILKTFISELIPAIGLSILFISWGRLKKFPLRFLKKNYKKASVYFFLSLTGVIPIMISMKQRGFYILPVYPFVAIGTGILLYPLVDFLMTKMDYKSKGFLFFKWISYSFIILGILLSLYFSDGYNRDKSKIKDIQTILQELPEGCTINISQDLWEDWSLHGYFYRFKDVSLDQDVQNKREYLLIKVDNYSDTLKSNYDIVNLNTINYLLVKKKEP